MPAKQTGSPMTYLVHGRQYIVIAVSDVDGAKLIAYALPQQRRNRRPIQSHISVGRPKHIIKVVGIVGRITDVDGVHR